MMSEYIPAAFHGPVSLLFCFFFHGRQLEWIIQWTETHGASYQKHYGDYPQNYGGRGRKLAGEIKYRYNNGQDGPDYAV
jgi:hypothetical protein